MRLAHKPACASHTSPNPENKNQALRLPARPTRNEPPPPLFTAVFSTFASKPRERNDPSDVISADMVLPPREYSTHPKGCREKAFGDIRLPSASLRSTLSKEVLRSRLPLALSR